MRTNPSDLINASYAILVHVLLRDVQTKYIQSLKTRRSAI